jgi:hypothetical protein
VGAEVGHARCGAPVEAGRGQSQRVPETPGKPFTPLKATGSPTKHRVLIGLLVYKRGRLSPFGVGLGQPLAASAVAELELAA